MYSQEELMGMTRDDLREIIDNMARNGIIFEMTAYPKSTKPYLVTAILDHQDPALVAKRAEERKNAEKEAVKEVPQVVAPPRKLPDWREMPDETPEDWVKKIYVKHLMREADPAGLSNYSYQLRGKMKKSKIEEAIMNSREYKEKHKPIQ
jgi:DNA-binding Lrp family transcriptional regulator